MTGLGTINSFIYNGEKYYFKVSSNIPKDIDDKYILDTSMEIKEIEKFFKANVKIDYENRKINIGI